MRHNFFYKKKKKKSSIRCIFLSYVDDCGCDFPMSDYGYVFLMSGRGCGRDRDLFFKKRFFVHVKSNETDS